MINFLIYHHSQKYSFTRRPNTQLYMQFACYRKQKIKKFINPQSRQQQNASPSPYHPIGTTSHIPTPQNTTTSQQPPVTTTKNSLKKSPRGVQRGHGFMAPLRFSSFPTKTPKNIFLPTFPSKVCRKINKILVVFTIKKVYHIKINYKQ